MPGTRRLEGPGGAAGHGQQGEHSERHMGEGHSAAATKLRSYECSRYEQSQTQKTTSVWELGASCVRKKEGLDRQVGQPQQTEDTCKQNVLAKLMVDLGDAP